MSTDPSAEAGGGTAGRGEARVQELSRAQRALARRAAESRAVIPSLELTARVEFASGPPPRLRAALIVACARGLRAVPRANAAYRDGAFELYGRVNVGVLLPTQDAYVVATVFDADSKAPETIEAELDALASRALAGSLTAPELSGSTFSLTDLSDTAVASVAPVVVPGHAAALGAGGIHPAPLARDGGIVAGHVMTITLGCDHRILYAGDAAAFLAAVKEALEDPTPSDRSQGTR